jgi:hypothetical protein
MSYYEPFPGFSAGSKTAGAVNGTMTVIPLNPPTTVSFNAVRFNAIFSTTIATISLTTNATSRTGTASLGFAITEQIVHYTRNDATTFSSSTSTNLIFGVTSSWSYSQTGASNSMSLSAIFKFGNGSTTSQDTLTASGTTNTSSAWALTPGAVVITAYNAAIMVNVPWASSIGSGPQLFGLMHSTGTASAGGTDVAIAAGGGWNFSHAYYDPIASGLIRVAPGSTRPFWYGAGITSTAGGTAPVSVIATALAVNSAGSLPLMWVAMGIL